MNIGSVIPGTRGRACRAIIGAVCGVVLSVNASAGPGPGESARTADASPSAAHSAPVKSDHLPLGGAGLPTAGARARIEGVDDADAAGPASGATPARTVGIGQVAGALGFVLALILIVFKAIRQGARAKGGLMAAAGPGGRAPSGVLSVLGRYPLARGQTLLLLKLDRRVLLVAQTVGSRGGPALATLTELTDPEEVAAISARCEEHRHGGAKFSVELERYENEHEATGAGPDEPAERAGPAVRSMRDRLAAWRGAPA
ncbi:MAG: hypothetical protein IT436_07390 [Phycisphaerales bacterium]|nr:hypothetical protein [Phycisphaerales bacterium]